MDNLEGDICYNIQQLMLAGGVPVDLRRFYFRIRISRNNRIMLIVGALEPDNEDDLLVLYPYIVRAIRRMVYLDMLYLENNLLYLQLAVSNRLVRDPLLAVRNHPVRYLNFMAEGIDDDWHLQDTVNQALAYFDDYREGNVVGSGDDVNADEELYTMMIISGFDLLPFADIMLVHYAPNLRDWRDIYPGDVTSSESSSNTSSSSYSSSEIDSDISNLSD